MWQLFWLKCWHESSNKRLSASSFLKFKRILDNEGPIHVRMPSSHGGRSSENVNILKTLQVTATYDCCIRIHRPCFWKLHTAVLLFETYNMEARKTSMNIAQREPNSYYDLSLRIERRRADLERDFDGHSCCVLSTSGCKVPDTMGITSTCFRICRCSGWSIHSRCSFT